MKKFSHWYKKNQLLTLLMILFFSSTVFVAFICTFITYKNTEKVFINSHKETTQILLTKIENDYEKLNDSIVNRFIEIDNNQFVYDYFTNQENDPVHQSTTIYNIASSVNSTKLLYENIPSNLVIIGKNERLYSQNGSNPIYDTRELVKKSYIQEAKKNPTKLNYIITDEGYSLFTKDQRQLIISKALLDKQQIIYGYAIMTIKETDFSKFYDTLLNKDIDQLWLYNKENDVVSTNQNDYSFKKINVKKIRQENSKNSTIHESKLNSFGYNILLYTNNRLVANELLIFPTIVFFLIAVVLVALILGYILIKKTMNPIYELSTSMERLANGNFSTKIKPHGTYDIQVLQISYNKMLDDLNLYMNTLISQEKDKRQLEFAALQLQIQPHFIYNTLTAIKFQVMKQHNKKATESIESFIRLLRYTIGQTKEFISIDEELTILTDYIQILKMRFGENIQVNIYNLLEKNSVSVPKLLLQPIVENAFIHAFPNEKTGRIDVLIDLVDDTLLIEIIDNGIGMSGERENKGNSFSGIGLNNIKERLSLVYGSAAFFSIQSSPGQGTAVKIQIFDYKKKS